MKFEEVQELLAVQGLEAEGQNLLLNKLAACAAPAEQKLSALQGWRHTILEDIHSKQRMLDKVDYCIYKLKHDK